MTPVSCAQLRRQKLSARLITEWLLRSSYSLKIKNGRARWAKYCSCSENRTRWRTCWNNHILHAARRFVLSCNILELCTPYFLLLIGFCFDFSKGFIVHNGYLAENERKRSNGRAYRRLTIVTSEGDIIHVRRYNDTGGKELKHYLTRS